MRRLILLLIAAFAAALFAAPAHATPYSGTNNTSAKMCQKGGWQHLTTSTGATFTSETACSSYAAHGGQLLTAPVVTATLVITAQASYGNCYYTVTGAGLAPASAINLTYSFDGGTYPFRTLYADGAGTINYVSPPSGFLAYQATGTTAAGLPIVSDVATC